MGLVSSLVTFAIGVLVGGFGIYVGAAVIEGRRDYEHAVWTAVAGAIVWTVVGTFFTLVPLLGPILTFLAYLAVLNLRYPGGWLSAAGIALVAWSALAVVLFAIDLLNLPWFDPVGVPGI